MDSLARIPTSPRGPVDSPDQALEDIELPGRVAIAIPDGTRKLDVVAALTALAQRTGSQTVAVVGLGMHRPMNPEELAPLQAVCPWPVVNHDPDSCVSLGEVGGVPCQVHPAFQEADTIVTVGTIELHQYAGFSGGHKGVVVGCGGRTTLNALHTQALTCHPKVQVGRLEENPFRNLVDALGEHIGVDLALQWVPGRGWWAGPPRSTLLVASQSLDPWVPTLELADCAVLRVPPSKAVNFYQASRAATYLGLSPNPPLREGARLVIDAACPEGLGRGPGEAFFAELLSAACPPWSGLLDMKIPDRAGGQRALMMARLAGRFKVEVAGVLKPQPLVAAGIHATSLPADEVAGPGALEVPDPFLRLPQHAPAPE